MSVDPFKVVGKLSVKNSATVVCVRQREVAGGSEEGVSRSFVGRMRRKYGELVENSPFLQNYLREEEGEFCFESGFEVLMGQAEVINWMRTKPEKLVLMRYPGEYKLAGGNLDPGETLEQAAIRELKEEFLDPAETQVPDAEIILRPFSVKQTRPIKSRSNLMHNFVAIAEENPWLNYLDIDEVNRCLKKRNDDFMEMIKDPDCDFWNKEIQEKEEVSPEVHELRWIPVEEALENCLTSMIHEQCVHVNEWQKKEFHKVSRDRRDPMVMTGAVLAELEVFPSVASLKSFCESVNMDALRKEEQWLFNAMTDEQVNAAFDDRLGKRQAMNPSFKPLSLLKTLREEQHAKMSSSGKL